MRTPTKHENKAKLDVPQNYAVCIESFGKNLDILPNTLGLEVGDGFCMSVNGEEKYLKVLSIQSNEQKAKYLAKQLIHPTNELFDSELFGSLNNKKNNCGTSAPKSPVEYVTQLKNMKRKNAETQTRSCNKVKEVGTQINGYEIPLENQIESSEDHSDLLEGCTSEITNEQIAALAECLRDIPNGQVYFYLYMNKRLLPKSRGKDAIQIRKWIDERQKMHFPAC
ncbi:unnamed protein product [Auanema sp. JU1783]|nr:unnamed protein product [Auanema sp. JU1783]